MNPVFERLFRMGNDISSAIPLQCELETPTNRYFIKTLDWENACGENSEREDMRGGEESPRHG